jgi:Pectate lyase superfamily protein
MKKATRAVSLLGLALFLASIQSASAQSPRLFDVTQYGATGRGTTSDMKAITAAIEASATAGGGTVYFPAGTYVTGTIHLKSNVTLWLASGATLLGTKDLSAYESVAPGGSGQDWYDALIVAKDVHDVAVVGLGVIDGNHVSNPKGEEHIRGPHALLFFNAENVTVRDITIQNSGNYSLILRHANEVTVDGLKTHGGWDGINMHDVKNATISNCHLSTGDDSLAGAYWENVTVSNCILNAAANGIRVGGRNVLISNTVIYGPAETPSGTSLRNVTEAGFQILPNGSGVGNKYATAGPVDNMVLSGITMIHVGTPIYVAYSSDAPYSARNLGVGRILINGLTALDAGKTPIYVSAPENNPAKSIIVTNARITFAGDATPSQSEGQGFSPYSVLNAYSVYARNVESFELHDVRVDFTAPDLRPAIFGENVGTLELDRFHAERAPGGSPSIEAASLGHLVIDGKPADVAKANVTALKAPQDPVTADHPFPITETVRNTGAAGIAQVPVHLGTETVSRSVWLQSGEKADITFTNLKYAMPGEISLRAGQLGKVLRVLQKQSAQPINAPFKTFHNVTTAFDQSNNSFYIRAEGDATVMHYADEYGTIYLDRGLPPNATVVVEVDNPDLRSNWPGLSGIIIRCHIDQPGTLGPYVILGSSPAAGTYLDWAGKDSGVLNHRAEAEGFTVWPRWLKLQRQGSRFVAFSSIDNVHWIEIGECDVLDATGALDVGMFAFRSSARFTDFAVKPQ